ncbi:hypothetical protein BJ875DRAFT_271799 [Amylocarpus encephaloides]|uniref:Uncharacterized protein n=1 Tax=Amylocarpus encephaloides TaxID=45428 RepID=A0A9P7YKV8_9HELO|nr:hypothetical protein BJ875DRAFT_271799 [Amylocarpus encephaloides]
MPDSAVANVHNGFLSSTPPDATSTAFRAPSDGSYKHVVYEPRKYTWVDSLLGILSFAVPEKKRAMVDPRSLQTQPESNRGSSPWILPVYVLSTRQDKDQHQIAMVAKCTIDTGNMQGNIVSRKFVEVLGYPESAVSPLTKEEEAGATGVTGHQLIPQGAIHLTWYHKESTRVFRDMRFLLSPNEHFDLIIGAWSIQNDRLLDVPNLMVDKVFLPITKLPREAPEDEKLRHRKHDVQERLDLAKAEFVKASVAQKPEIDRLKKEIGILERELKIWANTELNETQKLDHFEKLKEEIRSSEQKEKEKEKDEAPPAYSDEEQSKQSSSVPHKAG